MELALAVFFGFNDLIYIGLIHIEHICPVKTEQVIKISPFPQIKNSANSYNCIITFSFDVHICILHTALQVFEDIH